MKIETVLFDMDGVLVDYDFAHRLEVLAEIHHFQGISGLREELQRRQLV